MSCINSPGSSAGVHLSKSDRARLARETINKTIPAQLRANPRAQKGVLSAQLLVDLPALPRARSTPSPVIRVVDADTLAAAAQLCNDSTRRARVAVLSMASPLRPGGGVLSGATSQEESLCMRSTLYAGLRAEWYRLPEAGVVYSPDVLVFRGEATGRYVDMISCAAVRLPELSVDGTAYAEPRDRDGMRARMVQVMRCASAKGVTKLVLGALGCGAYGNPPEEVAELWRSVLLGSERRPAEAWAVDEVVFAIKPAGKQGRRNLDVFCRTFPSPVAG